MKSTRTILLMAIDSVPPKGIPILPLSTYLALTPAFLQPGTFKTTFLFTFNKWWKVFANTLSEDEARVEYEREAIPASGRSIYQAALSNLTPKSLATIDFANNERAPLLLVSGERDDCGVASLRDMRTITSS